MIHTKILRKLNFGARFLVLAAAMVSVHEMHGATISVTVGGVFCTAGKCSANPNATTVDFDAVVSGTPSSYSDGIATYTWSSLLSPFVSGTVSGEYAAPGATKGGSWTDNSTYLTVGSPNGRPSMVTIDFSTPISYFGLYMGSPDAYNHLQFDFYEFNSNQAFDGHQLLDPANGSWAEADYLNFNVSGGAISRIVMTSDSPAFETDNHAFVAATPEPLSVFLLGSGLVCLGLWRKRSCI